MASRCCCADLAFYTKYKTTVTKDIKSELHTSSLLKLFGIYFLFCVFLLDFRVELSYAIILYRSCKM